MVVPVFPEEANVLTLPGDKVGAFITNEEKIYSYLKDSTSSKSILAAQETMKIHTVRNGEHLSTIAKRYGCTVADIKTWTGLRSNTVKAGKKLTIYLYNKKLPEQKSVVSAASPEAKPGSGKYKYYTVKAGDSLYKIAQANKTTVPELKRLNNFGTKFSLVPGQKIKIGTL
jgi:membrane-bound lytic murein transglycosylase D